MKKQTMHPIDRRLKTGIDVGGTKIHIADTQKAGFYRYKTADYADLYELLDAYMHELGATPSAVAVTMAGPRDDNTGTIKLTNAPWPAFDPAIASKRYPGVEFMTANDMTATVAGVFREAGVNIHTLKHGMPTETGTKIAITISTGVGVGAALWDDRAKRHTYLQAEAGHVGFQPYTESQRAFLEHLFTKYEHPSIELAISGKHGIENWVEHLLGGLCAPKLTTAIDRARQAGKPVGAVLLEFATEGSGKDKDGAHRILAEMGALVGNVLADYALTYKATGGIYLTGSMSLALGEYWAENTDMSKMFVRCGTEDHATWLETMLSDIPIYLITDLDVAAIGALELARQL